MSCSRNGRKMATDRGWRAMCEPPLLRVLAWCPSRLPSDPASRLAHPREEEYERKLEAAEARLAQAQARQGTAEGQRRQAQEELRAARKRVESLEKALAEAEEQRDKHARAAESATRRAVTEEEARRQAQGVAKGLEAQRLGDANRARAAEEALATARQDLAALRAEKEAASRAAAALRRDIEALRMQAGMARPKGAGGGSKGRDEGPGSSGPATAAPTPASQSHSVPASPQKGVQIWARGAPTRGIPAPSSRPQSPPPLAADRSPPEAHAAPRSRGAVSTQEPAAPEGARAASADGERTAQGLLDPVLWGGSLARQAAALGPIGFLPAPGGGAAGIAGVAAAQGGSAMGSTGPPRLGSGDMGLPAAMAAGFEGLEDGLDSAVAALDAMFAVGSEPFAASDGLGMAGAAGSALPFPGEPDRVGHALSQQSLSRSCGNAGTSVLAGGWNMPGGYGQM